MQNISLYFPTNCIYSLQPGETARACSSSPRLAATVSVPLFISTNLVDGWLATARQGVPGLLAGPVRRCSSSWCPAKTISAGQELMPLSSGGSSRRAPSRLLPPPSTFC